MPKSRRKKYQVQQVAAMGAIGTSKYKPPPSPKQMEVKMKNIAQWAAERRAATHCVSGLHEYTPENTVWRKNGRRQCLECRRIAQRERYALQKRRKLALCLQTFGNLGAREGRYSYVRELET